MCVEGGGAVNNSIMDDSISVSVIDVGYLKDSTDKCDNLSLFSGYTDLTDTFMTDLLAC